MQEREQPPSARQRRASRRADTGTDVLVDGATATSAAPPPIEQRSDTDRHGGPAPTGITILAVLAAIGGVFGILGGLALLASGGFIGVATGSGALGGLAALIGAVTLVSGVG